jgi:hypothetical protein
VKTEERANRFPDIKPEREVNWGFRARSTFMIQIAENTPATPPIVESKTLSVNS